MGSFRIRLLVVIIIVTLAGFSLQSGYGSRNLVEPALRIIFYEDQWANRLVALINTHLPGYQPQEAVSDQMLQLPCAYTGIVQSFGSGRDARQGQAELFPGILLQVNPNSAVKPVLPGKVVLVQGEAEQYKVVIEHGQGLDSEYGKLKRVQVKTGAAVSKDTVLGRSGDQLYFAINAPQGPLDPGNLFP